MHDVEKWLNILQKSCDVITARVSMTSMTFQNHMKIFQRKNNNFLMTVQHQRLKIEYEQTGTYMKRPDRKYFKAAGKNKQFSTYAKQTKESKCSQ